MFGKPLKIGMILVLILAATLSSDYPGHPCVKGNSFHNIHSNSRDVVSAASGTNLDGFALFARLAVMRWCDALAVARG